MDKTTHSITQYEITFKFNKNKLESNYYKDKYTIFTPIFKQNSCYELKTTIKEDGILKLHIYGSMIDAINICTKTECLNINKIEEIKIEEIKKNK